MNQGIYTITNVLTGKRYVGSSSRIQRRWRDHRKALSKGTHHCSHLQRAWNKYGSEKFVFEIVEDTTDYFVREQSWLDATPRDLQYNTSPTAGSPLGMKLTAEQCSKISKALKGMAKSAEHCAALSEGQRDRAARQEEKERIGVFARNRIGTKQTEEHKQKRFKAQRETWALKSKEELEASRLKAAITNGTMLVIDGQTFYSLNHASSVLGISRYILKKRLM